MGLSCVRNFIQGSHSTKIKQRCQDAAKEAKSRTRLRAVQAELAYNFPWDVFIDCSARAITPKELEQELLSTWQQNGIFGSRSVGTCRQCCSGQQENQNHSKTSAISNQE